MASNNLENISQTNREEDDFKTFNYYQPNFILISQNPNHLKVLSDIIPFNNKKEQSGSVVILSKVGLKNFVFTSKIFVVCITSILANLMNNVSYQAYLKGNSSYKSVLDIPSYSKKLLESYKKNISLIKHPKMKKLWFLNLKMDLKLKYNKLMLKTVFIYKLILKFYLFFIVFTSTFFLAVVTGGGGSGFLNKLFGSDYSAKNSIVTNLSSSQYLNFSVDFLSHLQDNKGILVHQVLENETVESISANYSITKNTLTYNNNISDNNLKVGQKLYVPWEDGYIYYAQNNVSIGHLESLFKISGEEILNLNSHNNFNQSTQTYSKESLILIPINDYSVVDKLLKEEREREAAKAAELRAAVQRVQALAQYAVNTGCNVSVKNLNYGFIWPKIGPITQCYGKTPFSYNYASGLHSGLDIDGDTGDNIYASKSGTVTQAEWGGGYGFYVVIDHGNNVSTLYAHLSKINTHKGQKVEAGDIIGKMGSTGFSTGPHLHFEILIEGQNVNPLIYLP